MNIEKRIQLFLAMDHKIRLDSWTELLSIGKDFIDAKIQDRKMAEKIAEAIFYHRSLMGSSKAYESATDIDVQLCKISTPIARIAYGKTKPLLDYLKSELYYSNYRPDIFNKGEIEREIKEIVTQPEPPQTSP